MQNEGNCVILSNSLFITWFLFLSTHICHTHKHMHTVSVSQGGEWERVDPEGTDPYGHAAQWSAVWGQTDPAERWVFHTLAHKLNPGHAFKSGNKMHTSTHRHSLNFCFGPSCLLSSSPPLLLLFSSHPSASLTHSLSPPHLTGAEDTNSLLVLFVCVCVLLR